MLIPEGLSPNIPSGDYQSDPRSCEITKAAKQLEQLRNAWLNPPELAKHEPEVVPGYPDRLLPQNPSAAATLRGRTLTKLYNESPQWLKDVHAELDRAVSAAYGWPEDISESDALAKLLEYNLARVSSAKAIEPEGLDLSSDE